MLIMNKWILICLLVLVAAYLFAPNLFPSKKYEPDPALVSRIDSLEQKNKELEYYIVQLDSIQFAVDQQILELNTRIDNNKGKTTIIKEIYKEKGDNARKFTPSQVDSFFKDRYKF